ncbi:MAG: hypothetical protein WCT10_03930 [Patescibacteria group bacterium]|jgi:hypothetical protein
MKDPLIHGNSKMGRRVAIFNLPPLATCAPTAWCRQGKNGQPACYALRNNFLLPNVLRGARERLDFSRTDGFVDAMITAIKKARVRFFRFHSSGDFYSAEYVRKVLAIARACPETLFRTTTRRREFRAELQQLNSLPNFIVRESLDPDRPDPVLDLPFAALDSLPIAAAPGTIRCPNDCVQCGYSCWKQRDNMSLKER